MFFHIADNIAKGLDGRTILSRTEIWLAIISTHDNPGINRHPAQKIYAEFPGGFLTAAGLKNLHTLIAVRADETTHVFNHTENLHLHMLAEVQEFSDISKCHLLGGSDDNGLCISSPVPGGASMIR